MVLLGAAVLGALGTVGLDLAAAPLGAAGGLVAAAPLGAGGFMLPPGGHLDAGRASLPAWALPCGPEPGALAVDPSGCTGHPVPYPLDYQGFATGQCTWYVATRRRVAWHSPTGTVGGNAGTWLANARAAGYAVGPAPALGAIAVFGDAGPGHVAFVVGVAASGAYTVAEANWDYFGPRAPYLDLRWVPPGGTGSAQERLLGFIYGPGPG